ncbi:alpha/beta-hydrolase [Marasmius fiardii PR-910]|nr:alpha/beta-hydrolase [Marasmius fiardii PR-910]
MNGLSKQALSQAQKKMYAAEKMMNFRWISKVLASCSPRILTSVDVAPITLQLELAEIGQFAELAYSSVPISFVLDQLPHLVQNDFPFEGYDALQDADLVSDFHGSVANLHGFIAYRRRTNQLIVSLSGTSTPLQGLYDLRGNKTRHSSKRGMVHAGFWAIYKGIRRSILSGIRQGLEQYHEVSELVVTGHSMGGALSYLLLLDLLPENDTIRPSGVHLKLAVFGAPRVGDIDLVNYWQQVSQDYRARHGADSFREHSVKAYNDGVPSLPPLKLGYRHFTQEPLYFVHGHLFCVPSSEAEYALFRVEVDPDASIPPEHPRGGHNYYNGRDQERFIRRMRWLNDALAKSDTDWQRKYKKLVDKNSKSS